MRVRGGFSLASVLALGLVGSVAGCGDEESLEPVKRDESTGGAGGAGGTGGAGGAGGGGDAIAWAPCPVVTGGEGAGAECAEVQLPLDWRDPEGATIPVFVKRVVGAAASRRQLWLLAGGPGDAGASLDTVVEQILAGDPTLEIYIPDHRGVGRSSRLGCPQESPVDGSIAPEAWPDCIAALEATWGERLGAFNVTNAAKDVGALIERTRAPGQEAHVFGVSYGTLWGQRYLQVFPDQATSVTLDSLCQSGLCSYLTYDYWHNEVGKRFMEACAGDAFCAGKMGPDPWATLGDFLDALDAGACPGLQALGVSRPLGQVLAASLLETFQLRALVPALAYRGLRCEPADVAAFEHLFALLTAPPGPAPQRSLLHSTVLEMHVSLSEMVEAAPPDVAEIEAVEEGAYFAFRRGSFLRGLHDLWPRYERDAYVGKYAPTEVPMLLLNGTLDPQTPLEFALEIAPNYTQPRQTFVAIDRAVHGSVLSSPTATPPHTPCGLSLWMSFTKDPTAPVDTSCVADVMPLGFEGSAAMAQQLLGTGDLWENGAAAAAAGASPTSADAEAVRRAAEALRGTYQRARQRLALTAD